MSFGFGFGFPKPRSLGAWTPALLPNLSLWLDAADASTITLNASTISQWRDKSGNARHVAQATAVNQPTYNTTGLNGRSVLEFDGVNDVLLNTAAGLPVGTSARTAAIVYQPLRTTSGNNTLFSQGITNSPGNWFALQARTGSSDPYFAGFVADVSVAGSVTATTKIAVCSFDGTTVTLTRNGSAFASGTPTLNTGANSFRVGCSPDNTENAQALIAEIIYLSSVATTNERQLIEGYLAWKWGGI